RRGRARRRRTSRPAPPRGPVRPHPTRDRGPRATGARALEPRDRRAARDLAEDGVQPRRAHLREDRRVDPRRRRSVRDAARPPTGAGTRSDAAYCGRVTSITRVPRLNLLIEISVMILLAMLYAN